MYRKKSLVGEESVFENAIFDILNAIIQTMLTIHFRKIKL